MLALKYTLGPQDSSLQAADISSCLYLSQHRPLLSFFACMLPLASAQVSGLAGRLHKQFQSSIPCLLPAKLAGSPWALEEDLMVEMASVGQL